MFRSLSFSLLLLASAGAQADTTRIAFGSCLHQDKPAPILDAVVARQPDAFVLLGDNVYGDTTDMKELQRKYQTLGAKPGYQALKQASPVYAIWDDHDYGQNDAGKEYPHKAASKRIMLDFFEEPADSPRRSRSDGNYASYWIEDNGHFIHLILPDLRWNREALSKESTDDLIPGLKPENTGPYAATQGRTMLGETQWQWLEQELLKPADLTIIGSSIQLLPEFTGWESWANFPDDRSRLIQFIENNKIADVVFISGDTHWGEVSRTFVNHPQPLWEVTSSGLTEEWKEISPNRHRLGEGFSQVNFGELDIDWAAGEVGLSLFDVSGQPLEQYTMILSED